MPLPSFVVISFTLTVNIRFLFNLVRDHVIAAATTCLDLQIEL